MLESFVNFKDIDKAPWMIFIWGAVLASVGILASSNLWFHINVGGVSVNLTGLFAVMFTIIPAVFFVTQMIKKEEALEEDYIKKHYHESKFFERHVKDFVILLYFFAGVTLAFAFWYVVMPPLSAFLASYMPFLSNIIPPQANGDAFIPQVAKINEMRGLTGAVTGLHPNFLPILFNNITVMIFSFGFSLVLGAGAVFIIVWNASVLGVAIGKDATGLFDIPLLSSLYVLHGVPEIAGYVAAALAGGLLSAAIIRGHWKRMVNVAYDAMLIILFALFSIVMGALIEASTGLIFWASLIIWWGVFTYMIMRFFIKP